MFPYGLFKNTNDRLNNISDTNYNDKEPIKINNIDNVVYICSKP